jgi:predicted lipoprotein with Yx(FWY)xxD motif
MKRIFALPVAAVAVGLVVAGCGGGGGSSSNSGGAYGGGSSTKSAASKPGAATGATVDVKSSSLGRILVNSQGQTLYLFEKDKGPTSTCSAACAAAWPPVTGTAKGGAGTTASKFGTTRRSDGMTQVTYGGHPLYTYAGDSAPGQTNGEGLKQFGAEWYVLSPAGKKVEKEGS